MSKYPRGRREPKSSPGRANALSRVLAELKRLLARYEALGASRAEIESQVDVSLPTLKRALALGISQGWIESPFRGQYVLRQPGVTLDLAEGQEGVHGLVLTTLSEPTSILRIVAGRLRERQEAKVSDTGRWVSVYADWKGRVVEFRIYRTDRINVYVASTRQPYRWHEVEELAGWITAWIAPFDSDRLWVVQVGLNVDYKGFRMRGCRAMEWKAWRNAFRQVYQKREDLLRDEVHAWMRPGEISLSNLARTLKEGSALAQRERIEAKILKQLELQAEIERLKNPPTPPEPAGPKERKNYSPSSALSDGFG
jgi:hypothetical protein